MDAAWMIKGYQPKDELDLDNPPRGEDFNPENYRPKCPFVGRFSFMCGDWCALYVKQHRMCSIKILAITVYTK